jgi:hypothetical protein
MELKLLDKNHENEEEEYYYEKREIFRKLYAYKEIELIDGSAGAVGDLILKATHIAPLFLGSEPVYQAIETMAVQLLLQLAVLEKHGFTLLFWQPADISIVNHTYYILNNLQYLVPLHKKNKTQLVLNYPITESVVTTNLIAPELKKMERLPFLTHRSASYYSLGLLCLTTSQYALEELAGTKLFYFITRCLQPEPAKRSCVFL